MDICTQSDVARKAGKRLENAPNFIIPHVGRRESTWGSHAAGPCLYSPGPTSAPPLISMLGRAACEKPGTTAACLVDSTCLPMLYMGL